MKRIFLIAFLLLFAALPAQAQELPATESWTPPDLNGLTASSPIELRVLAFAQQEVGYVAPENAPNKYAYWFDGSNNPWCSEFVAWCARQCDKTWGTECLGTIYPRVGTTTGTAMCYIKDNRYVGARGTSFDGEKQWLIGASEYLGKYDFIPQPGDVMWLHIYDGADPMDHTAIVEGVSRDASGVIWVHVIEGNMDDSVRRHTYELKSKDIIAYGTATVRVHTRLEGDSRYGGVNELRKELLLLGYKASSDYTYRLSGRTFSALREFQRDHGLPQGAMTIETRAALDKALEELAP